MESEKFLVVAVEENGKINPRFALTYQLEDDGTEDTMATMEKIRDVANILPGPAGQQIHGIFRVERIA